MGSPTWIWYPGDFEIWLHWLVSMRREERGVIYPPFWRLDTFYPSVTFRKRFSLAEPEEVRLYTDGSYTVTLDGSKLYTSLDCLTIGEGNHELVISVINQKHLPALYVAGKMLFSDATWQVSHYSGSDSPSHERENPARWAAAGAWNFDSASEPPSSFRLSTREVYPLNVERSASSLFVDFGKEIFGSVRLTVTEGQGSVFLAYGESQEEALSPEQCETFDRLEITSEQGIRTLW
jgi:alpha-L-rhamnosidase